jgi:hypothetical protein
MLFKLVNIVISFIFVILLFLARYKEQIGNVRFNKEELAFVQHILGTGHQYRPMEEMRSWK